MRADLNPCRWRKHEATIIHALKILLLKRNHRTQVIFRLLYPRPAGWAYPYRPEILRGTGPAKPTAISRLVRSSMPDGRDSSDSGRQITSWSGRGYTLNLGHKKFDGGQIGEIHQIHVGEYRRSRVGEFHRGQVVENIEIELAKFNEMRSADFGWDANRSCVRISSIYRRKYKSRTAWSVSLRSNYGSHG